MKGVVLLENKIVFKLWGNNALFSDPVTRMGGEKCSYHVPTYQALKGIAEAIYWKPTIKWVVDKVCIVKQIQTETKCVKPRKYTTSGNDLSIYTYLYDVEYIVEAHFEWNEQRSDLLNDQDENKHFFIAKRMLERGGKRDIFLGTRECFGYVEPCKFTNETSFYKDVNELSLGIMFHGFDYPSETGSNQLFTRLWKVFMRNGIIDFARPEECEIRKEVRNMTYTAKPTTGIEDDLLHYSILYPEVNSL